MKIKSANSKEKTILSYEDSIPYDENWLSKIKAIPGKVYSIVEHAETYTAELELSFQIRRIKHKKFGLHFTERLYRQYYDSANRQMCIERTGLVQGSKYDTEDNEGVSERDNLDDLLALQTLSGGLHPTRRTNKDELHGVLGVSGEDESGKETKGES
jgi:hypothetical protein